MDKRITEKTDMFGRVKQVCDTNIALVDGIPMLKTAFEDFLAGCTKVAELKERLSLDNKGLAREKRKCWNDLALALEGLANGLQAFARSNNDEVLYVQATFSVSAFQGQRCGDAVSAAQALMALAQEHLAALGVYNVSPEKLTSAQALTLRLIQLDPEPVTTITTDKAVRKSLFVEMRKTNNILRDRMDKLVRTMRLSEPLFFDAYFFARKMRHPGLRHRQPEPAPGAEQAVLPATEVLTQALSNGSENMEGEMVVAPSATVPVSENGVH